VAVVIPFSLLFGKQNSPMRHPILLFATGLLVLFFSACSTPDKRISDRRAEFEKYPPDIQQKIRAGQVNVGFTQEMVLMALGEPARRFTRKTEAGDTEVWSYHDNSPQFSFGFGVGSSSRHSAVGGGVGVTTGGYDPDEKVRVEFRSGVVTAVDILKK